MIHCSPGPIRLTKAHSLAISIFYFLTILLAKARDSFFISSHFRRVYSCFCYCKDQLGDYRIDLLEPPKIEFFFSSSEVFTGLDTAFPASHGGPTTTA